jgi:hypothetical protein
MSEVARITTDHRRLYESGSTTMTTTTTPKLKLRQGHVLIAAVLFIGAILKVGGFALIAALFS